MQNDCPTQRSGFALVEALIALVIIGVVFLGLEGSLTLVLRSLADSERQSTATRIAEAQRERIFDRLDAVSRDQHFVWSTTMR